VKEEEEEETKAEKMAQHNETLSENIRRKYRHQKKEKIRNENTHKQPYLARQLIAASN